MRVGFFALRGGRRGAGQPLGLGYLCPPHAQWCWGPSVGARLLSDGASHYDIDGAMLIGVTVMESDS